MALTKRNILFLMVIILSIPPRGSGNSVISKSGMGRGKKSKEKDMDTIDQVMSFKCTSSVQKASMTTFNFFLLDIS